LGLDSLFSDAPPASFQVGAVVHCVARLFTHEAFQGIGGRGLVAFPGMVPLLPTVHAVWGWPLIGPPVPVPRSWVPAASASVPGPRPTGLLALVAAVGSGLLLVAPAALVLGWPSFLYKA
jgi:hypothetical protein